MAVAVAVGPSPAQLLCLGLAALISYILVTRDRYVVLGVCSTFPFLIVPMPILGPTQPHTYWVLEGVFPEVKSAEK